MLGTLLMIVMFVTALFLILLVLIQRGKGGGLAGAFGGMGGQSAFGTKAGDLFTRITIVVAAFWIILCMGAVKYSSSKRSLVDQGMGAEDKPQQAIGGEQAPGDGQEEAPPEGPG